MREFFRIDAQLVFVPHSGQNLALEPSAAPHEWQLACMISLKESGAIILASSLDVMAFVHEGSLLSVVNL